MRMQAKQKYRQKLLCEWSEEKKCNSITNQYRRFVPLSKSLQPIIVCKIECKCMPEFKPHGMLDRKFTLLLQYCSDIYQIKWLPAE